MTQAHYIHTMHAPHTAHTVRAAHANMYNTHTIYITYTAYKYTVCTISMIHTMHTTPSYGVALYAKKHISVTGLLKTDFSGNQSKQSVYQLIGTCQEVKSISIRPCEEVFGYEAWVALHSTHLLHASKLCLDNC